MQSYILCEEVVAWSCENILYTATDILVPIPCSLYCQYQAQSDERLVNSKISIVSFEKEMHNVSLFVTRLLCNNSNKAKCMSNISG